MGGVDAGAGECAVEGDGPFAQGRTAALDHVYVDNARYCWSNTAASNLQPR